MEGVAAVRGPDRASEVLEVVQGHETQSGASHLPLLVGSACGRLAYGAFSPDEVIPLIEVTFTSKSETRMLRDLRGDAAQAFIDVVHEVRFHNHTFLIRSLTFVLVSLTLGPTPSTGQALDLPDLSPQLRKKCIIALCRVCGNRVLLPRSLCIPLCYNRMDPPLYRGGFADVWKGKHQGCHVAVKVLRVYSTSDLEKMTSVSSNRLLEVCIRGLILTTAEILQGSCDLECSSPSECIAVIGGDDG